MYKSALFFKEWRKKQNLTGEKLAEQLDVIQQHISNIESGRIVISNKLLSVLSEIMNSNDFQEFSALVDFDRSPPEIQRKLMQLEPYKNESVILYFGEDFTKNIQTLRDCLNNFQIEFKRDYIKDYFALKVTDESMKGVLDFDDIALVRKTPSINENQIVFATLDGTPLVRYLRRDQFGGYMLLGANNFFNPIAVPLTKERFRIFGVVEIIVKHYAESNVFKIEYSENENDGEKKMNKKSIHFGKNNIIKGNINIGVISEQKLDAEKYNELNDFVVDLDYGQDNEVDNDINVGVILKDPDQKKK